MSEANNTSRRDFLKKTTATASVASALALSPLNSVANAKGDDTIRIGLVGAGGRGTGAAQQALRAHPKNKLVAIGDLFPDRLKTSVDNLTRGKDSTERVDLPESRQFSGFDAYKNVIDNCDVVILATSPHYRPMHLRYAVEKGNHAFVEKPVATDPTHLRHIWETCKMAEAKNLTIVSGLCWRYDPSKKAVMDRVLDGQIGDIVSIETNYMTGGLWHRGQDDNWSDMEYQNRNWLYHTWLSGDHICEQAIHSLDKMGWAMGDEPPVLCRGVGGRQVRTDAKYGNIYDHFGLVYEYANGVRGFHQCRQYPGAVSGNTYDFIYGTKGTANVFGHEITGEKPWRLGFDKDGNRVKFKKGNKYQIEHDHLFDALRENRTINNGTYMCRSTMLAILGRMVAYSGATIKWDEAWNATENLAPKSYTMGDLPETPTAVPGRKTYNTFGLKK